MSSYLPEVLVAVDLQTDTDAYGGRARQQRWSKKTGFAEGRSFAVAVAEAELQGDTFISDTVHSLVEKRVKKKRHRRSPAKRRIVGDKAQTSNFWRSLRNFLSQLQRIRVQVAHDGLVLYNISP